MAARGEVFIRNEAGEVKLWRTDLTGHGNVQVGEEFTVRQVNQYGSSTLVKGGIKRKVRVTEVEEVDRNYHILTVEILKERKPDSRKQAGLF